MEVGRVSLTARVDIPRIALTFERRLDLHGGTVGTRDVGDAVPSLLHLSMPWRQRGSAAARHSNPWHVAHARLRLKCMLPERDKMDRLLELGATYSSGAPDPC